MDTKPPLAAALDAVELHGAASALADEASPNARVFIQAALNQAIETDVPVGDFREALRLLRVGVEAVTSLADRPYPSKHALAKARAARQSSLERVLREHLKETLRQKGEPGRSNAIRSFIETIPLKEKARTKLLSDVGTAEQYIRECEIDDSNPATRAIALWAWLEAVGWPGHLIVACVLADGAYPAIEALSLFGVPPEDVTRPKNPPV